MKFKPCLKGEKVSISLSSLDTYRKDGFTTIRITENGIVMTLNDHESQNGSVFISQTKLQEMVKEIFDRQRKNT